MRTHPLLAFAASTVGLASGALVLAPPAMAATRPSAHHTHAHAHTHAHRTTGRAHTKSARAAFFTAIGPTRMLVPSSITHPIRVRLMPSGVWRRLRMCESSDNYRADTGNGYYGAYQFTLGSWDLVGGRGTPNQASPATQDAAAKRLMELQGWSAWPSCAWAVHTTAARS